MSTTTTGSMSATDADIRAILTQYTRVALVGASAKPERPSHGVMGFLLRHGFDVTPVNPGLAGQAIHGRAVVPSLDEAAPLEIVDVFRAPDQVGPVVEDAIRLGARVVWMQLGVINREAAAMARAAGLTVVMDRCPAIEWPRLGLGSGPGGRGPA
jgi:predicted CoA-binding protein